MGQTQNFGLEWFGAEGRISDKNYKFSDRDRRTIDSLLQSLFQHDHTAVAVPIVGPTQAPDLTLASVGGTIPAATDVYYRISYLDANGNETEASVSNFLRTIDPILSPAVPNLSTVTTGGTLDAGTYRYALAFEQTGIGVTRAPNDAVITVPTGTSTNTITVTLDPDPPSGADAWRVYRRGPGEDEYSLLATVAIGATPPTSYVDDGSVTGDATKNRPTKNTTNSTNKVTVDIDALDLPLDSGVASWRIYKTTFGGTFQANSLLATVSDTTTAGGTDLVTTYEDTGQALSRGVPLDSTTVPANVPGLDAASAFASASDPLPASIAPRGVHAHNTFLLGTLVHNKIYNQFTPPHDIYVERLDAFFQDIPSGLDGSNYDTIRVSDANTVDEVQSVYTDCTTVDEVQTVSNDATSGTFTLTFDAGEATPPTTAAIAYDALPTAVETALEDLPNITDVSVAGSGTTSDPWVITFLDPGAQNVNQLTGDGTGLTGGTLSIATATEGSDGGTFTLEFDGQVTGTIACGAPGAALATPDTTSIEEKLQALSNITDVGVTGTGTEADPYLITFLNPGSQDVAQLLADDTLLNGSAFVSTVTNGKAATVIDLDIQSVGTGYYFWQAPTSQAEQEAEDAPATGGSQVSDQFATNDLAMELDTQNETNEWVVGVLPAGDYVARFWVSLGATAVADLNVWDDIATPVSLGSQTINTESSLYSPAFQVKFTSTGTETIKLEVEKTDAGTDVVRVDKYDYDADLPFLSGLCTVRALITGTPTDNGGDAMVNVWY